MSSDSALPSPAKRPTLTERPLSGNTLSSSAKQGTQKANKYHAAGSKRLHTRTTSYSRALGKAGKINSTQHLVEDGLRHHHKISGTSIPSTSPRISALKRNSSHAALAKNSSYANLRKNKSATALARNASHTQLHRKTGLGPSAPRQRKDTSKKNRGFEIGDRSSDDEIGGDLEEEADWEDSATQSPKHTRDNSAVLSQPAPTTTNQSSIAERSPKASNGTSSLPEPSLRHNRSAPNFGARASSASPVRSPDPPANPTLLPHNPPSSRATPAVPSIFAQAPRDALPRNNSSFTHINHLDTASSQDHILDTPNTGNAFLNTPNTGKSAGGSSSADGGVSHFLSSKPTATTGNHQRRTSFGSDYDSPSSFLPHYHPQQSTSPEKVRTNGGTAPSSSMSPTTSKSKQHRSRTQQRLELQRRETMRAAAPTTPTTPLLLADAHSRRGGSSSALSLHSRSGSHGRSRAGATADPASANAARLMIKQDYEAAERQLAVVRRFRNPVVEAVGRLKERGLLPGLEKGAASGSGKERDRRKKSGGSSRRDLGGGSRNSKSELDLKAGPGGAAPRSSFEDADTHTEASRQSSNGRATRPAHSSAASTAANPHHRRQGSHDDIGLSRSQGSSDEHLHGDGDGGGNGAGERGIGGGESGVSAEMEMMRRMWESREVYDKGDDG
ncbi:hypothetical protein EPUS_04710 [Endocarpon pusillum Z07020]|uniref:Uncharacterized protein n=1 Tax=Endocarpon pusillum (strain Z07020 / HMAS-L-300199) TaxID=1263415 RepID=U1FZQ4_ENDPU|nr:uncharacterized protein EPUS_04710 [Endocarpon pusillum Z07020]ERF70432.1 hypothetical protein EPUS_04710 [Endocarpon pusillum Z07020]